MCDKMKLNKWWAPFLTLIFLMHYMACVCDNTPPGVWRGQFVFCFFQSLTTAQSTAFHAFFIDLKVVNVGYYGAQSELHDVKCDAWSLGAIPHILLGARVPFSGAPLKGKQPIVLCLTL
ncbi:hypothetical protein TcG_09532 [Trypanosoma cruzi]|nr:hypothetical protein TcG_09532 [Trypanosoma cruzi]